MPVMVNKKQTREQRRLKRVWLRMNGLSCADADRMRDCTISHINQYLHANRERLISVRRSSRYTPSQLSTNHITQEAPISESAGVGKEPLGGVA